MSTSELTRDALAYKKEQGQRVGQVPYGSRLAADGVKLIPEPDERRAIELIQALRAEGMSLRAIAARLEAEGLRPRGRRWYAKTVANILEAAELARLGFQPRSGQRWHATQIVRMVAEQRGMGE